MMINIETIRIAAVILVAVIYIAIGFAGMKETE